MKEIVEPKDEFGAADETWPRIVRQHERNSPRLQRAIERREAIAAAGGAGKYYWSRAKQIMGIVAFFLVGAAVLFLAFLMESKESDSSDDLSPEDAVRMQQIIEDENFPLLPGTPRTPPTEKIDAQ